MPDSTSSTLTTESEEKTLLEWKSPSRPFKKRDRDYFTTIGAMVFLIVVILFFIKEWMLIGAIIALTFLVYILNTISPEEVEHKITTKSIVSAGHSYLWNELREFWFTKKYDHLMLVIQTKLRFPGRVLILLDGQEKERVKKILSSYLSFKEAPIKTWMDNAADWLSQKVSLEKTS